MHIFLKIFSGEYCIMEEEQSVKKEHNPVLSLLKIFASPQSVDYINNKTSFHLHNLLTEQRHVYTWNLSFIIKDDVAEGLKQILSVDKDISEKFHHMAKNTSLLEQAARAVSQAVWEGKKVIIYGCGSTGRLAKQVESAIWRPFWKKIKKSELWQKLKASVPEDIEDRLIGEMTGGDRALISALEGFEDLQIVGKLQMKDRGLEKGDVLFCITEGGETSSVIGAMLAGVEQYGDLTPERTKEASLHLYFLYNNPDELLLPFERSRSVIKNPAVTKINLTTGPQAITGSTRMQAATSETYAMGLILEAGIFLMLKDLLSEEDLTISGFSSPPDLQKRMLAFEDIQNLLSDSSKDMERFAALETQTYKNNRFATYFAKKALITVFIDCAERSPTFHLYPLDNIHEKEKKCWLQVWTEADDFKQAWQNFLGRNFLGLDESFYKPRFLDQIKDDYLREEATRSLSLAGNDQEGLYDFSFSPKNICSKGPQQGDMGVLVCLDEEIEQLSHPDSSFFRFLTLFKEKKANLALITAGDLDVQQAKTIIRRLPIDPNTDVVLHFFMPGGSDPLGVKKQILIKMLLNTHSTAVMAQMGRIVGNTMTNVNPSNLKLIGRATYLVMSHVNDALSSQEWIKKYGEIQPLTYGQANAVLFEAMDFAAEQEGQTSEVALCIIRILEALKEKRFIGWDKALSVAQTTGLENFLEKHNSNLRRRPE
jgi:hypothetical protein